MANYTSTTRAFDATAGDYNTERAKLIPGYALIYGAAIDLIRDWGGPVNPRVLDLGAGTGLFSEMVRNALPDCQLHLLDGSQGMLDEARRRFDGAGAVTFVKDDMGTADLGEGWDLVVSSLAIHHLGDAQKQSLFGRVFGSLNAGGMFLNVEQVAGPDPLTDDWYGRVWKRDIVANGATDEQITAASQRMVFDKCATAEDQLGWMRDAGFCAVDCSVKVWRFAVLTGRKA